MEMRVLSVINLKGGVAKTVSSIAIAHLLAAKGFRVLLVDNDKQGDASRGYSRRNEDGAGIDEIMTARRPDMGRLIQHTDFQGLDIVTANMKLLKANLEVLLDQTRQQQTRLKKALDQVRDLYDFCIIDNAPDITRFEEEGEGMSIFCTYRFDVDGTSYTVSGSTKFPVTAGGIRILGDPANPDRLYGLTSVKVDQITGNQLVANSRKYTISDNVVVYEYRNGQYYLSSLARTENGGDITGWYDKAESAGGRIRVIVIK